MININDFPEGTKLNIVYSAPITDFYDEKLPQVYYAVNNFEIPSSFLGSGLSYENFFFIEKIDFSEVEILRLYNATSEVPSLTSEELILNLPSIKKVDFSCRFNKVNTITINCGDELVELISYPYGTSKNDYTVTINSNSNNIKKFTQLRCDNHAKEFHINLNCENLTTSPYVGVYSDITYLTYHSGFPNVKYSSNDNYYYSKLPNLTRESCLSILNNLYDFTGNGETPNSSQGKLKVHANFLTTVGDEISIASEKGWVIQAS